jgi:hypothetical protein
MGDANGGHLDDLRSSCRPGPDSPPGQRPAPHDASLAGRAWYRFEMRIVERAKGVASELKTQATQTASEAMDGAGAEKMKEVLDDLNAALPVIRSGGWALEEVTIELGLPPKVVAKFKAIEEHTDGEVEAILAENAERKVAVLLLKTLHHARRVTKKMQIAHLTTQGFALGLGLIPSVELKFA